MALCSVSAQNYKPFSSTYGWSFYTSQKSIVDSNFGFIFIECDLRGNYWFRHEIFDAMPLEIIDMNGRIVSSNISKHFISRIWLKLDNNEIITLSYDNCSTVCIGFSRIHKVEKQYQISSYFLLTNDEIEKLKAHKIIKMRSELYCGVIMDMNLSRDSIFLQKNFEWLNSQILSFYDK